MDSRYQFTNWTTEEFEGRFGGQPYIFAPGETKEFDPDKLHMLHILSKQLADKELAKGAAGVLRSKEAGNDYGKAIDANGNLYKITPEMRKELMVKCIGELANKPVPYPETQEEEAGATKQTTENIAELQDQVRNLTEMVQALTNKLGETKSEPTPPAPVTPAGNGEPPAEVVPKTPEASNIGLTRDVLIEMAQDKGITIPEGATKDQIIELLGNTRGSAEPLATMPA